MTHVRLCVTYPFGSFFALTASFIRPPTQTEIDDGTALDADDWQPVDPDTVSAKLIDPLGTLTLHDYLGSPADIVRDGVGEYHLDVNPRVPGTWTFRFESTGNGAAADEKTFKVDETAFP